ncbi:hypothetical protein Mmc1_0008 [Magnetococcus marinus MC-1]|uniref:Uncharacterized protein n=1 Tax=Magnetococcus marinus (strain ATCC BAA-1437 / JCM 17883 / MC-1) TaxID=156889 RepID=A0L3J4_MAGMM|nr:hypothetical protein [Magnetococcus marinus]ABK42537.1 hypothetical protein Mmc1_0008 [Magnetococcus marinus MC-1]
MRHLAFAALLLLLAAPLQAAQPSEHAPAMVKMARQAVKDAKSALLQTNHDAMTFATDVEALHARINHLEMRYTELLKEVTTKRAAFTLLEEELRAADLTLKDMEKPMREAKEQYRKAQLMSLEYPEVSTEKERKAYYDVQKLVSQQTKGQLQGLAVLKNRLTLAYESLESAEQALERTRHEAEQLRSQLAEANGVIRPVAD